MPSPAPARLSGSLIGLAIGDALGSVVEARPPEEARHYVADYLRAGRAQELGFGDFPFGQYSDDTQLARELLLSLVARGGFDPGDFGRRIATLVEHDRLIRGGLGTTGAAWRLLAGVHWEEAAEPSPYAGNGAAMRAGPLGALWNSDMTRLRATALGQARVTHQDPRAAAGALAVAGAVALGAREGPIDPARFLVALDELVRPADATVADAILGMKVWVGLDPERAVRHVAASGLEPTAQGRWHGISSFVTSSVCWSLYAFLREPEDYWAAITTAIEVGGDTDTIGAMSGAISGARVGLERLPLHLAGRLNDRGEWAFEALCDLAQSCGVAMGAD